MKPTVVQLEGGEEGSEVTFEQAFGEFSEARGRGRARRNKRRTERQQNRIARRRARKKSRQEMRAEQQEARQSRKDTRKSRRVARKGMGKEDDSADTESQTGDSGSGSGDSGSGSDSGSGDSGSGSGAPINQEGDTTKDNQGEGQGEYQGEGGGYSSDDEGQNPEGADAVVDSETGESDEESGFTGDCNFDGAIMLSPEDAEWNEYFSSANGYAKINPKVKELARSIEQHKEKISRSKNLHDRKIDQIRSGENDDSNKKIVLRLRRGIVDLKEKLAILESKLASYSRFEGEYSEVSGGKRTIARRKAEVRHAKRRARQERKQARKQARKRMGTPVEAGLEPEFANQRIEVPAESSNFNGTGLIGLDEQGDVDAPETRKFDLMFSDADGGQPKMKVDIKSIAIGVGVAVLGIYLYKKYKK